MVRPAPYWSVFERLRRTVSPSLGDVGHVEADQFAAAQRAREAEEE